MAAKANRCRHMVLSHIRDNLETLTSQLDTVDDASKDSESLLYTRMVNHFTQALHTA